MSEQQPEALHMAQILRLSPGNKAAALEAAAMLVAHHAHIAELEQRLAEALAAMSNARDMISTDRTAFVDCIAIHELSTDLDPESFVVYAEGIWLEKDDAEALHDYDRALALIDAAMGKDQPASLDGLEVKDSSFGEWLDSGGERRESER